MDIITLALAKLYTKNTVIGMGAIKGSPCMISSIVDNLDGTHDITFSWKDASDVTHTGTLTVSNGETPTISVQPITNGNRVTFSTTNPSQSVSYDVKNGVNGVSIALANVDDNNHLILRLTDGTTIDCGLIKTVKGEDGFSPTVTATRVSDGVEINITDKSGTTEAKVDDGISPTVRVQRNPSNNGVIITTTDAEGTTTATINDGSVASNVNYETAVTNKPKINNVEVSGNKTLNEYGINIPTKNSQLLNDSGFITASDIPSVDSSLSQVSENAVQNKIITNELRQTQSTLNDTITDVGANTTAIGILNGNSTVVGSVDKKISDALANLDRLTKQIVNELPDVADAVENVIYLVPTDDVYVQWTIVDDGLGGKEWARLGTTDVDLSGYYNKTQTDELLGEKQNTITGAVSTVTSMNVSANRVMVSDANGKVSASTITTTELEALDDVSDNIQTQLDNKQDKLTFDTTPTAQSSNPVTSDGIKTSLDEKQDVLTFDNVPTENSNNVVKSGGVYSELAKKQDVIQYTELPTASVDLLDKVYQYIGVTNTDYTNGVFYKCVLDEDTATYVWKEAVENNYVVDPNYVHTDNNFTNALKTKLDGIEDNAQVNVQADWEEDDTTSDAYIVNKPTLGSVAEKDFTTNVRPNDSGIPDSNAIYHAITSAVSSIWKPHGNITVSELLPSLLIEENIGNIYNVTDSGITTQYFINGAGQTINAGDSVGIISAGSNQIMFNLMGNILDFDDYQKKELTTAIEGATTVEGVLSALSSGKVSTNLISSDASASNKLVSASVLNNRVREVFRIPYNMTITNFLARFVSVGIHVGEVFIEGNIGGTAVNSWCSYEANIISVTDSYVGNIKITNLSNGTEFLYKSYNTGSFNWVLVTERDLPLVKYLYCDGASYTSLNDLLSVVVTSIGQIASSGGSAGTFNGVWTGKSHFSIQWACSSFISASNWSGWFSLTLENSWENHFIYSNSVVNSVITTHRVIV